MANRAAQLYKYTKLPTGWRYCKAMFYPNNRIKPHAVLTPDGEQIIKDGYYCLSYNRKWEPVGNDPAEAVRLLMKKRGELLTVANGGSVVREPEGEPKDRVVYNPHSKLGYKISSTAEPTQTPSRQRGWSPKSSKSRAR